MESDMKWGYMDAMDAAIKTMKDKNKHAQEMGRLSVKSRKAKLGKAFNDRMTYISSLAVAARKKKKDLSPDTLAIERLIV